MACFPPFLASHHNPPPTFSLSLSFSSTQPGYSLPSEVLDFCPPDPSASCVSLGEDPHAGSLADVYGHAPHGAHLLNACPAIQGPAEVALQLWVDL